MGKQCVVKGCKSTWKAGCTMTFHRFPCNEKFKKKWLAAINLKGKYSKHAVVCGLHFKRSDYYANEPKRLKPNVWPSDSQYSKSIDTNIILEPSRKKDSDIYSSELFKLLTAQSTMAPRSRTNIPVRRPIKKKYALHKINEGPSLLPLDVNKDNEDLFCEDLSLPEYSDSEEENPDEVQAGYYCNDCCQAIKGYRYICIECDDFDLCSECETKGIHSEHCMLRVPESKSYDEIAAVLDRLRKAMSDENIKKDNRLTDEVNELIEEDHFTGVKSHVDVTKDSDDQLLSEETDPFEGRKSNSISNRLKKRTCQNGDQFVPTKRKKNSLESAPRGSSASIADIRSVDSEVNRYRKVTRLSSFPDNKEKNIVSETAAHSTKITNVNLEKEKLLINDFIDHQKHQISDNLNIQTNKITNVMAHLSSKTNLEVTDVTRLTSSNPINNIKTIPSSNKQGVVRNMSQIATNSNTEMILTPELSMEPNTITKMANLDDGLKCNTINVKIVVTNASHLIPPHKFVTSKSHQPIMILQAINEPIVTAVSNIVPKSDDVMVVSQQASQRKEQIAIVNNDSRPNTDDNTSTIL